MEWPDLHTVVFSIVIAISSVSSFSKGCKDEKDFLDLQTRLNKLSLTIAPPTSNNRDYALVLKYR
jgi:hypothetical protein